MEPSSGTVVGGKYRLDRQLARGGMGSVWVARHLDLDLPIAIKFMGVTSSDQETARGRFAREAKSAASLRSPHVVQVLDYDAAGDIPYIVMELLEGEDLNQRLTRHGRLHLGEISSIVSELAEGLVLAHAIGIVHRDLKPSNVFLARVGAEEIVKILDFGVAKETRLDAPDAQTTTGVVVGSPSYMSPEQARGGRIDARSDLWSVGVMVFQALTGKRPFEGANLGDVLVRICSDAIPIATEVSPDLPPEVDRFFERALCRSPDGRFPDAPALAHALEALAKAVEVAPGPSSTGSRALAPRSRPGEVAPRDDATGSVIAPRNDKDAVTVAHKIDLTAPTVVHRVEPSSTARSAVSAVPTDLVPRAERTGTIEVRAAGTSPAIAVPEFDSPLGESPTTTAAVTSHQERPASGRRGLVWGLAGAGAVAMLWIVTQTGLFSSTPKSPPAALGVDATRAPAVGNTAPVETAAEAANPAAASASAESPAASTTETPSASASAPQPAGVPVRRYPPHTRSTGAPTSAPTVDPKFGLPGGHN